MNLFTRLRPFFLPMLVLLCSAVPARAQTAASVVEEMIGQMERRMANVQDFTIETEQYTTYYQKTDDEVGYRTRTVWKGNTPMAMADIEPTDYQANAAQLRKLAAAATYEGAETLDGQDVHVLYVDDVTALTDETEDEVPGSMTFYVDAERYVPLRMTYQVEMERDGTTQQLNPVISFEDYREVEGLLLPYKTSMVIENIDTGMSPEEREEAEQSLAEMEKQLEEMPAAQRRMMEGMMKQQLERLREVLAGGSMTMVMEVEDVQVNTGLSDDLFEQP